MREGSRTFFSRLAAKAQRALEQEGGETDEGEAEGEDESSLARQVVQRLLGGAPPQTALESKTRYLQLAFNTPLGDVQRLLPRIPKDPRILIEVGTPLAKREGLDAIRAVRSLWPGYVVADLKTMDGAAEEVQMAASAGANGVTVLGAAPKEALDVFIRAAGEAGVDAMVDMLNVPDPLRVLRPLKKPPRVVVLHRGRDEEGAFGKVIQYKHVSRVRSKFDVLISAAGGVDLREAQSAAFNGASIVVVNIVPAGSPWKGIQTTEDIAFIAKKFLQTID